MSLIKPAYTQITRERAIQMFGIKMVSTLERTRKMVYPMEGELIYGHTSSMKSMAVAEKKYRPPFSAVWWDPYNYIDHNSMLAIAKELNQEIDHHSQTVTVHNPVTRSFVSRRWGTVGSLMNTRNQALCYATIDAAMAEIVQEESHVK